MWRVYGKNNSEKYLIRKVEYFGGFMDRKYVATTIRSSKPVDFQIGDYFTYRGERFTLNYIPSVSKKSSINSTGDAFTYENIVFNSYSDELTRCEFLDYVLHDNIIHFSSLPTFGFYAASVQDLADRVQANLNRIYTGSNQWTVTVHPGFESPAGVFINIDKLTVWNALSLFKKFNANFIIRGRNITIGTAGQVIDNIFEYGKGKGLVKIEKLSQPDQQIITRLRVYGSTRNIPHRYYNKLSNASLENYLPDNMAVQNLMLPSFPYETLDPFLDSENISELGIMEGSVFFDGSNELLPEIYPSMEGMTAQQLRNAGITVSLDAGDNGNLDELAKGATNEDGTSISDNGIFDEGETVPSFKISLKDVFGNSENLVDIISDGASISFKSGMCTGREFEIIGCEKSGNKYVLTCNRVEDQGINLFFPYKDYPILSGDEFVLLNIEMPEVYVKAASQRLLEAGKEHLSKNDYTRYTYQVKLSPVLMARNPSLSDSLIEGDYLMFTDEDLGVDGSIIIDTLRIKEGEDIIPSYEVTLSDEKQVGAIQKIQNQIDMIISGGTGGFSEEQAKSFITLYGSRLFLSKLKPDTAQEYIIFEKGIESAFVLVEGDGTRDVDQGLTEGDIEASGEVTQSFTESFQSTGGATTLGELLNVDETFDTIPDAVYSFKKQNGIFYPILGGGGGSTAKLTLSYVSDASASIVHGRDYDIEFLFSSTVSGEETGAGTVSYRVNGRVVGGGTIQQGSTRFNIGKFLILGDNTVTVAVTDSYGSSRTLTYNISAVSVSLNSTFNAQQIFTGSILFPFTPVGFGTMNIHIYLDGVKLTTVTTSASSKQLTYNIPAQPHGAHMIRAYMEIAGEGITSNELVYSIISVQSGNNTVIISSAFKDNSATQYDTILIPFMVYDPASIRTDIELLVNGEVISTRNVDRSLQQWAYSFAGNGPYSLVIRKGSVVKVFTFDVAESDIKDLEETERLQLKLLSAGRNNSESNRDVWEYDGIKTLFTGFNWNSDGWLTGDKGTSLRVSGDAKISIPFKIFSTDFKLNGKTIEFEFSTQDVTDLDYVLLSCMQGGKGFEITPQKATFKSEQTTLVTQFKENEHIRISIAVQQSAKQRLISMYINGKFSGVLQYPTSDSFVQASPVNISAQGKRATINIYAIRVYDTDLEHWQVLNNRIFDYPVASEKADIYARNNILGADGTISYNLLANQLPVLIITGDLPAYKGDKKICSVIFEDRQNPERSFTADEAEHDVQGTSSQYYPRKNFKSKFKKGFKMTLSGEHKEGFQTHENTLPATVFTHKADFAESSGTHNTGIAKVVENLLKSLNILTPPQKINRDIRTTVDGFAMAIFHRRTENDPLEFVGKYNFNTDKAAENTFGFESPAECWEVLNNTSDRVLFRVSDPISADWSNDYEGRFPDGNKDFTNLKRMTDFVVSCIGNPTKFKSEASSYFDLDFLLSYYAITELFAMVDQRAKNCFWTSFDKTIWLPIFYDNDTCLGINNEGVNVFYFDVEGHDRIGTQSVWNGADSELWKLVEQAFPAEIKAMYQRIRKDDTLSYDSVLSILNGEHSDRWSETVYNEDGMYKYILPLIEDGNGSYLYAAQGSREEHRKWWLSNRFRYMDSKYDTGDFRDDFLTMRLYTPTGNLAVPPNADFIVDVFASQYIKAKWGSYETAKRVRVGEVTTFEAPAIQFNDTETILYGASYIRSLGDLSGKYAGTIDVSKATKLTELIIGSDKAGYQNTNLVVLHVGNNKLLRKIDIRNCPNLTGSLDLSGCDNIEEIYATGTGINGVELMSGGIVKTMQLPATITNLRLIGQTSLGAGLTLAGYDNLSSLRVEECPGVNGYLIAKQSKNLQNIRLVGINAADADLSVIYTMIGKNGIDENGYVTQSAVVTGKIHVTNAHQVYLDAVRDAFNELIITYDNLLPSPSRTIQVRSSVNSSALVGAKVTINGTGYLTDNDGRVMVYEHEPLAVKVEMDGFKTVEVAYQGSLTNTTNTITLDNYVTLTVTVKDQYARLMKDIPITFSGETKYTGTDGVVKFTTSRGLYMISAAYDGDVVQVQVNVVNTNVSSSITLDYNLEKLRPQYDGSAQILVMPSTDNTIELDITGHQGATIDWGDGNIEEVTSSAISHIYSTMDFYNIRISGSSITTFGMSYYHRSLMYAFWTIGDLSLRNLSFNAHSRLEFISDDVFVHDNARASFQGCLSGCFRLKEISATLFNNCVSATSFQDAFSNCRLLSSIPDGLFSNCPNVTNFRSTFTACYQLTEIPSGIFNNCTKVTTFQSVFNDCTAIKSIPSGLFDNCPNVTDFNYVVAGTGITEIPAGIFNNCTKVTSFDGGFYGCQALVSIPAGLFDNCPNITSFGALFYGCWSLTSTPSGLFDKCTKVTNYYQAFRGCTSLIYAGMPMYLPSAARTELFFGCHVLKTLICKSETPVTILPNTIQDNNNLKIYVPDDSVEIYKTATNWIVYASKIYPMSQLPV